LEKEQSIPTSEVSTSGRLVSEVVMELDWVLETRQQMDLKIKETKIPISEERNKSIENMIRENPRAQAVAEQDYTERLNQHIIPTNTASLLESQLRIQR
jgi:hypothetical protein